MENSEWCNLPQYDYDLYFNQESQKSPLFMSSLFTLYRSQLHCDTYNWQEKKQQQTKLYIFIWLFRFHTVNDWMNKHSLRAMRIPADNHTPLSHTLFLFLLLNHTFLSHTLLSSTLHLLSDTNKLEGCLKSCSYFKQSQIYRF